MHGFTDKPTKELREDEFGIQQYIAGLKEFILKCDTPMTIAIQGDWGSGKTSMMNMIREQLGENVITTWFNTWQYSQFNMGDSLSVSFLSRLVSELKTDDDQNNENVRKAFKILGRIAKNVGVIALDTFVGGKVAEKVESGMAVAEQQELDLPQAINELKKQFQIVVNSKVEAAGSNVDRLVIFIDDLDRLHPGKAVELLEVLKLFLDCDNCVFVLAIDYAVVSQGVKQKYGELIGEEKGKSFFDKIIQVPFKMPVAQYNVKQYVANSLQTLGINVSDTEADSYVKLIQRSVGCNPRAMKRLFNAFLLLNKIAANGNDIELAQRKTLFAILCLQLSFENVYNYIVQNADDCYDGTLLHSLTTPEAYTEGSDSDRLAHELHLQTDTDIMNVADFMNEFVRVLSQDDGVLTENEIRSFINILRFSTITANSSTVSNTEANLERHYRYYNREIIKDVLYAIQGNVNGPFKIYQTRTNNNPNWKKYYAGGWKPIPTSFGNVNVEFKVETSLQNKESALSVYIYAADKADRRKFVERMQTWYSNQDYGFVFLEEYCGFWLNNKTSNADSREEIIQYFTSIIPALTAEIEKTISV